MWPGEQQPPGGPQYPQQNPQWQNPQASPYQQPSPYQQASPYQQPQQGYPTAQPWGPPTPGGPGGPSGPQGPAPSGNRKALTIGIAVVAAVAVIGAAVIGGVYLMGDDKKKTDVADGRTTSPSASQSASPTPSDSSAPGNGGFDGAQRGMPGDIDLKPVVPGWQVVKRTERNVAFDVPKDWTLGSEDTLIGFEDNGKPAVTMGAPAYYKQNWCEHSSRAAVGSKGAKGATSVQNAAEVQAESWAYWGYGKGKGKYTKATAKPFTNSHGISGYSASSTATNVPTTSKCDSSSGAAYAVAWIGADKEMTVWVLYTDRGVPDQVSEQTIETIQSSIRPLTTKK